MKNFSLVFLGCLAASLTESLASNPKENSAILITRSPSWLNTEEY